MSNPNRTENSHQVVIRNDDSTEVWGKNSAGCTTYEGYSKYDNNTGITTNITGHAISTGGISGNKKST